MRTFSLTHVHHSAKQLRQKNTQFQMIKLEERKKKLDLARLQANECYRIRCIQRTGAIFFAWKMMILENRQKCKRLLMHQEFKIYHGILNSWKTKTRELQCQRAATTVARNRRIEQQKEIKAVKFHDANLLSKAIVSWELYMKLESKFYSWLEAPQLKMQQERKK
jgi:hypothetical protein